MPQRKARRRPANNELPSSSPQSTLAQGKEPAAAFQLIVINACLYNDDVRLPQRPTPALVTPFYSHYRPFVAPLKRTSLWTDEYWQTKVAHVPFGRHSALPGAYRLHHECISRLHARIVYVTGVTMHKQLCRLYPPIRRSVTATLDEKSGEDMTPPVAASCGDTLSNSFVTPYYLLLNHSENAVFVNIDEVMKGRSVALQEGDVVSFLECAYDEDAGILDLSLQAKTCLTTSAPPPETELRESADAVGEQLRKLVEDSLWNCARRGFTNSDPSCSTDPRNVFVSGRLVGRRRLYPVPHLIDEYVRWWDRQVDLRRDVKLLPTSLNSAPVWMVSGNHLLCPPRVDLNVPISTSSLLKKDEEASSWPVTTTLAPTLSPSRASRCGADDIPELFRNATVIEALRRWLHDTEDMEEVADSVQSPLAPYFLLDRAWLWNLVRRHRSPSSLSPLQHARDVEAHRLASLGPGNTGGSEAAVHHRSSSFVKMESGSCGGCEREPLDSPSKKCYATEAVAERFRVSLSSSLDDGTAPHPLPVTSPRSPSRLRFLLEELKERQRGDGDDLRVNGKGYPPSSAVERGKTDSPVPVPAVRRSLCLEVDAMEASADNVMDDEPRRGSSIPVSSSLHQGTRPSLPSPPPVNRAGTSTGIPAVRLQPAILPVYVFTRRTISPDRCTREGSALEQHSRRFPNTAGTHRGGGMARGPAIGASAAVRQFVYYYDEPDGPSKRKATVEDQRACEQCRVGCGNRSQQRGKATSDVRRVARALTDSSTTPQLPATEYEAAAEEPPLKTAEHAQAGGGCSVEVTSGFTWLDESEEDAAAAAVVPQPRNRAAILRAARKGCSSVPRRAVRPRERKTKTADPRRRKAATFQTRQRR